MSNIFGMYNLIYYFRLHNDDFKGANTIEKIRNNDFSLSQTMYFDVSDFW